MIMGCLNGDRKAQEQLYRDYYKVMMNLCMRYTGNEADAMSVLNQGFLKVFRNMEKYDPSQAGLYAWIRTIVVNTCLDHLKVRQKDIRSVQLDGSYEVELQPEVISKYNESMILAMVQKLPPATRAVFNLYVIEGYQHKEIGVLLDISEGTSKWHLSEAKKKLKVLLEEEAGKL